MFPSREVRARTDQGGMALVIAISLLALFSVLGTYYFKNMGLEVDRTAVDIREARARLLAEAGIRAALAELERAYRQGEPEPLVGRKEYHFPTYGMQQSETGPAFQELEGDALAATATVAIEDENGKINLNHAPPSVISDVLGVDSAVARQVAQSLPPVNPTGRWFIHLDELVLRGLLTPEQYAGLPRGWVTVSTVTDHENPAAFINVNSVAPQVLASIAGMPPETAGDLAAQEFGSVAELGAAVGGPATFRIRPEPGSLAEYSSVLTTASRCFRILSEGHYSAVNGESASNSAEALVLFDEAGTYRILEWRTENVALPEPEADPDPESAATASEPTDA